MPRKVLVNDEYILKISMQLDELAKTTKEILDHVKRLDKQTEKIRVLPEVFLDAIDHGYINKDLIVTKSLSKLAEWLIGFYEMEELSPYFLTQFKKRNGKKYALTSLQEAIKLAKRKKKKKDLEIQMMNIKKEKSQGK